VFRKVVTSGESGVELAAMDLSLRLGIDCSGWVPKKPSKLHADFIAKYHFQQTDSLGFQKAVENNIIDADGIILITRGEKNPRMRYAVRTALKHEKQFLNVDLKQYSQFEAASLMCSWLQIQKIKTLFITGPPQEMDDAIYKDTQKILETAFYLDFVKSGLGPGLKGVRFNTSDKSAKIYPSTVEEAVERLKTELPLKDRILMSNMDSNELDLLLDGLGGYIKQTYGIYSGNEALIQSCAQIGNLNNPLPDEACQVILRSLWNNLQQTHKLRLIK
jgi:hypothetical protein